MMQTLQTPPKRDMRSATILALLPRFPQAVESCPAGTLVGSAWRHAEQLETKRMELHETWQVMSKREDALWHRLRAVSPAHDHAQIAAQRSELEALRAALPQACLAADKARTAAGDARVRALDLWRASVLLRMGINDEAALREDLGRWLSEPQRSKEIDHPVTRWELLIALIGKPAAEEVVLP